MNLKNLIKNAILLKSKENVLIVCDKEKEEIARMFYDICEDLEKEVILVKIKTRKESKREPPKPIIEAMKKSDIILGITSISLTHTQAVRNAIRNGARVATMPGITKEMFPALNIDYNLLSKRCKEIKKLFSGVTEINVKTKLGTNISFKCKGRKVSMEDGILDHPGSLYNLPAGEVGTTPIENSSDGKIVFDICMVGIEKIKEPIEVIVKKGKITKIKGKNEARKLKQIIRKADKNARTLCEFSLGINSKTKLIGKVLNDEKALGTCHIAFGDNISLHGKNKSNVHLDGVINKPTVWFDNKLIMKNGEFVLRG